MSATRKILILSANPKNTARLRVDEEAREIRAALRRSEYRDQFQIEQRQAVGLRDFRQAIFECRPQIVHFSGHGESNGIMVEDQVGNAVLVDPNALAGLFGLSKQYIDCVLLNACFSEVQAEAINEHINYVIGMRQGIEDKAAIEFAVGFYDALGAGETVEGAFRFGCNAIEIYNLPGHLIPRLLAKGQTYQVQPTSQIYEARDQDNSGGASIDGSTGEYNRQELFYTLKYNLTTDDLHELAFIMDIPFVEHGSDVDNAIGILQYAENRNRIQDLIENLKRIQTNMQSVSFDLDNKDALRESLSNSYIPAERRIRVQASNKCNLNCSFCHWDEFEKEVHPHYERVIKMIESLKREGQQASIYPRPNIAFTLTGGEPLENERHWEKFISAVKVYGEDDGGNVNSAYLLTNATKLDEYKIGVIKREHLRRIRVSLNYADNGEVPERETRIREVKNLLGEVDDAEIRFNHVISRGSLSEISQFLKFIVNEFGKWIPSSVKGVAFIQQAGDADTDVFSLAKEWCEFTGFSLQHDYLGTRKLATRIENGLLVEFIKVNCDVKDDYITRCFDCVQERDIAVSADARIRVCSGWDENLRPKFKYAYVDVDSPLVGISGVIRRQYGLAGFYGHFPLLVSKLEGRTLPEFFRQRLFDLNQLRKLLTEAGCPPRTQDIDSILAQVGNILLKAPFPFRKLYEEGSYDQRILEHSTQLCKILLRAAYDAAGDCSKGMNRRSLLNGALLVLAYLTVDESLFSTGRTVLVRGMAVRLLEELSRGRGRTEDFLIISTYYIATIAFESVAPSVVNLFVDSLLEGELQEKSCEIQYIKGCIYRQLNEQSKAIHAFEASFKISEENLRIRKDHRVRLYKEVRAESQRSLGALKKSMPGSEAESRKHFLISQSLSSMDRTTLRYTSLFSDGYALLLRYFADEYGKPILPENGYRAYTYLSDSISLNRQFYASLIRIALLDLAFDRLQEAKDHLLQARRVFSRRGFLTDQEYLNSVLCRILLLYTLYESDKKNFDMGDFSQLLGLNIESCSNVGRRDIECVRDDVEILRKIISDKYERYEWDVVLRYLNLHIDQFVDGCNRLLGIP